MLRLLGINTFCPLYPTNIWLDPGAGVGGKVGACVGAGVAGVSVVGAKVVGAKVVGTAVAVGVTVVGALVVVGGAVVVTGGKVVGANVVGGTVVVVTGGSVVGAKVAGGKVVGGGPHGQQGWPWAYTVVLKQRGSTFEALGMALTTSS